MIVACLLPAPSGGIAATFNWRIFTAWDSDFYEKIAIFGYSNPHAIAFFTLFLLLVRGVMALWLPFAIAGTLVNNLAY